MMSEEVMAEFFDHLVLYFEIDRMKKELKPWMLERWQKDNPPKYLKYFEEWFSNITNDQVLGYYKQMTTKLY